MNRAVMKEDPKIKTLTMRVSVCIPSACSKVHATSCCPVARAGKSHVRGWPKSAASTRQFPGIGDSLGMQVGVVDRTDVGRSRLRGSLAAVRLGRHRSVVGFILG